MAIMTFAQFCEMKQSGRRGPGVKMVGMYDRKKDTSRCAKRMGMYTPAKPALPVAWDLLNVNNKKSGVLGS